MTTILIVSNFADFYAGELESRYPELTVLRGRTPQEALAQAGDADVMVGLGQDFNEPLIAAAPKVKWIHALTSGVDNILRAPSLGADVVLTSSSGAHGPQMSEAALTMMLFMARDMRRLLGSQSERSWDPYEPDTLYRKTVAILGVGHIALDLARRCKALGMRTVGVASQQRDAEGFDAIFTRDAVTEAVRDARHLVVILPLDPTTRGFVDARVFAALPQGAYLTNLSRGSVVVEDDMVAALDSGRLAGAGLDVFATEPLPAESPLWHHPKVIVSPHIGGKSRTYREQVLPYLLDNLEHFLAGAPGKMRTFSRD